MKRFIKRLIGTFTHSKDEAAELIINTAHVLLLVHRINEKRTSLNLNIIQLCSTPIAAEAVMRLMLENAPVSYSYKDGYEGLFDAMKAKAEELDRENKHCGNPLGDIEDVLSQILLQRVLRGVGIHGISNENDS